MASNLSNIHLALIPLIAALAFYFGPLQSLLIDNALHYGPQFLHRFRPQPIIIDTSRNISYRGSYSSLYPHVEHYQNIFYAEEPSGERRFAPPIPVRPAQGSVIDATQPGAWCPQGTGDVLPFTSQVLNISENCLSLRVARSKNVPITTKLPVVVWMHGGGHALGSGSDILYTPDGLLDQALAEAQPLIWVAINYRLGFFGFATSRAMIEEKYTNAGLRDQLAALEWVRDNIHAFGGDPEKVTVVGQSVGASDISLQLTAFGGERGVPFQQAVMMSGGPGLNFNTKSDLVATNTAQIARDVGCVMDNDDQSLATLKCLQKVDFELLTNLSIAASRAARPPFGEGFFYPTWDGDFIQDRPSELMREGKFSKGIPVIASWVANDGAWYALPTTSTDEDVLGSFGLWLFSLSESTQKGLLELYPLEDFTHMVREEYDGPISAQYYRAAQMNRDIWFTCPVLDFAWQYVKNGGAQPSQVRLYEHNATRFTPAFEMMGVPMWRVAHLSDIPYVLNIPHLEGGVDNSAPQLELSKTVSKAFVQFVAGDIHKTDANNMLEGWPAAFANVTQDELAHKFPRQVSLQVFGGPYGTAPVTVAKDSSSSTTVEDAVQWEKLFARCEFINSHQMREEAGV